MKNCTGCKWAEWKHTAAGKLHPSGEGACTFKYKPPPLPAAFYWIDNPRLGGGSISRRSELQSHCPYFEREANK